MIALLLALAVSKPVAWEDEILCWVDSGVCGPRVVRLGAWDPRPADSDWRANTPISVPKAWAPDETGARSTYAY